MHHYHKFSQLPSVSVRIFVLFAYFSFNSCSNEETTTNQPVKLNGEWKIVDFKHSILRGVQSDSLLSLLLDESTLIIKSDRLWLNLGTETDSGKIAVDKTGEFFGFSSNKGDLYSCRLYPLNHPETLIMRSPKDTLTILLKSLH